MIIDQARSSWLRLVGRLAGAGVVLGALSGCGTDTPGGSRTSCDLGGCTVTFSRDGTPEVSILGISATLVGVQGNQATFRVAGQTVTVPVGGESQAEGFTVRLERATDTEVVVRVSPGGGG